MLVGVEADTVAGGVCRGSVFFGAVAVCLPDDAEVVVPDCDFTSVLYPFLVQTARGVDWGAVPLEALADAVSPVDHRRRVERSAVRGRSHRGRRGDPRRDRSGRGHDRGRRDPGPPVTPVPARTARCDDLRGVQVDVLPGVDTAFLVASPAMLQLCVPHAAGWFVAPDVYGVFYGLPLRLATTARRLDASPGVARVDGRGDDARGAAGHRGRGDARPRCRLADELREGLDLPPTGSAIVSVVGAEPGLEQSLAAAGIKGATRADGCRLSFHAATTTGRTWPPCALGRGTGPGRGQLSSSRSRRTPPEGHAAAMRTQQ